MNLGYPMPILKGELQLRIPRKEAAFRYWMNVSTKNECDLSEKAAKKKYQQVATSSTTKTFRIRKSLKITSESDEELS